MSTAQKQRRMQTAGQYLTAPAMTRGDWERFVEQNGHTPNWPPDVFHEHTFERSLGLKS